MPSYDINLNINAKDAAQARSGGAAKPLIDPAALKRVEKGLKDLPKELQKILSSTLTPELTKVIREVNKRLTGAGGAGGSGLSKADLKDVARIMSNELAAKLSKTITAESAKGGVRPTGDPSIDRLGKTLGVKLDKMSGDMVRKLDSIVRRRTGGEGLSPEAAREISRVISSVVKRVVPPTTGRAVVETKELSKNVGSLARNILTLIKEIGEMKRSGGGISGREVAKTAQSLQEIVRTWAALRRQFGETTKAYKDVSSEVKGLKDKFDTLSKDIKGLRTQLGARVRETKTGLREEPFKLITKAVGEIKKAIPAEKQFGPLIQKLDKLTSSLDDIDNVAKEVREFTKEFKGFVKESKKAGVKIEGEKSIINMLKQVEKLGKAIDVKLNVKDLFKEIKKLEETPVKLPIELDKKSVEAAKKEVTKSPIKLKVEVPKDELKREITKAYENVTGGLPPIVPKIETKGLKGIKLLEAQRENIRRAIREFEAVDLQFIKEDDIKSLEVAAKKIEELENSYRKLGREIDKVRGVKPTPIEAPTRKGTSLPRYKSPKMLEDALRLRTARPITYRERIVSPGMKDIGVDPGMVTRHGKEAKEAIEQNVINLSKSLETLQEFMVKTIQDEFKAKKGRWQIVKGAGVEKARDIFTTGGADVRGTRQWKLQIADIGKILSSFSKDLQKELSAKSTADIVERYRDQLVINFINDMEGAIEQIPALIARWLKTTAPKILEKWDFGEAKGLPGVPELGKIKEQFGAQAAVSDEMVKAIKGVFKTDVGREKLFKETFGKLFAQQRLEEQELLRTVAIPAAKITKTGGAVFETTQGAKRSLTQFATFTTGLERMYDVLAKAQKLDVRKIEAGEITAVGVRPGPEELDAANKIAKKLLVDIGEKISEDPKKLTISGLRPKTFIARQYEEAGLLRGTRLKKAGAIEDLPGFMKEIRAAIKTADISKGVSKFVDAMEKAGISAYDVAKSMDVLQFENVYDVLLKVIKGIEGPAIPGKKGIRMPGKEPLRALARTPAFEKNIRDFEKSVRQVEQLMPLSEMKRPRREAHLENIVNLRTQVTKAYEGMTKSLDPKKQKEFLKNINVRLQEMFRDAKEIQKEFEALGEGVKGEAFVSKRMIGKKPAGVERLTSLGIPETQASSIVELTQKGTMFKKEGFEEGIEYLRALKGINIKLYADSLRSMAPLGEEFGNAARNITGVTNAMAGMSEELRKSMKLPPELAEKELRAEFPALRTTKERGIIAGGRYGEVGYGYNVLAELRHSAGTFEDQILISGKLADALTAAVKTIIQPSPGGRVRFQDIGAGVEEYAQAVGPVAGEEGKQLLIDFKNSVEEASKTFQDVLGVPQKYKGRADKALIEDVRKSIAIVRGEEVEVQAAKLAEVFLNYFGRKFTTRYGSKGVAVTPTGKVDLPDILSAFPEAAAKIQPLEAGRKARATLGTAVLPKTMGEIASELLEEGLEGGVFTEKELSSIRTQLMASGNKFMLDLFKDAEKGIAVPEEATVQKGVFTKFSKLFSRLFEGEELKNDIEGVLQLKEKYEETLGEQAKLYKEAPIDVRISAYGAGKRGLQAEVLEKIIGNVIGIGKRGETTIPTTLGKEKYGRLLEGGELGRGELASITETLGFKGADAPRKDIKQAIIKKYSGIKDELAEQLVQLEVESKFYVDVIDELGKVRKSIVGPAFLSIVEESGEFPEWMKKQVEKGEKGIRLNLPAFAAYKTIFGEGSKFLKEVEGNLVSDAEEHWEYIKALQFYLGENTELIKQIGSKVTDKYDISELREFTPHTGVFRADPETMKRSLASTIFDVEKFTKPFFVDLPTTDPRKIKEAQAAGRKPGKDPFYFPGPLARGVHPEPLIAGEFGPRPVSRRMQQVVNAAKRVEAALDETTEITLEYADVVEKFPGYIGNLLKRSQELKAVGEVKGTGAQAQKAEAEKELKKILETLKAQVSPTRQAPASLITEHQLLGPGKQLRRFDPTKPLSELQLVVKEFETTAFKVLDPRIAPEKTNPFEAYTTAIARAGDILVGKSRAPGFKGKKPPKDYTTILERNVQEGEDAVLKLAKETGFGVDRESELNRALTSLEKAKISYYEELAKTAVGKEGSIAKVMFQRRIPGVLGKAITATVDRRKELDTFTKTLKSVTEEFSDVFSMLGQETFLDMENAAKVIEGISKEHKSNIRKQMKAGLPVLKQTELGIPESYARKLDVEFTKRFKVTEEDVEKIATPGKPTKGTFFDLLSYVAELEDAIKGNQAAFGDVTTYIENELVPYIESVRFPFTGISSVQPYRAKLIERRTGGAGARNLAQNVLTVPGIPEMNLEEFGKQIEKVREVRETLFETREVMHKAEAPEEQVQRFTSLIEALDTAISNVIPKYIAHQQKLDFDGDQIEIHTATVGESRREIKQHFDNLTRDIESFGAKWTDAFTYIDATLKQAPTSAEYPLADMAKAFEKKFPGERGFEFLRKPFLTEGLEYLDTEKKLKVLGEEAGDLSMVLRGVVKESLRKPEDIKKALETIEGVGEKGEAGDFVNAINKLDNSISKMIEAGISDRLFQEKYKDAIEAQLFKLHTGQETEAYTRLSRVAERPIGFGGGFIGGERYKPTPEFRRRWPTGGALGKTPEKEFHTMMNELYRFAIQTGMDVKHAGEKTVSSDIVKFLEYGGKAVENLWMKIKEGEKGYTDLADFSKTINKSIKSRLGKLTTPELRKEEEKIAVGRGEKALPEGVSRKQLMESVIEKVGFKGFLEEMSYQIREQAVQSLMQEIKSLPPALQKARTGLATTADEALRSWAAEQVQSTLDQGFRIINSYITQLDQPLYGFRTSTSNLENQLDKYRKRYKIDVEKGEDITTPEFGFPGLGKRQVAQFTESYKRAKATAKNMADTFSALSAEEGKTAYHRMVATSMQSIFDRQKRIESILNQLGGYKPTGDIAERVIKGDVPTLEEGVGPIFKPIKVTDKASLQKLRDSLRTMNDRVEEYSDLAGIPLLNDPGKLDIEIKTRKGFTQIAEAMVRQGGLLEEGTDDYGVVVDQITDALVERAQALYQMDKVISAMKGKGFERIALQAIFPKSEEKRRAIRRATFEEERGGTGPARGGRATLPGGGAAGRGAAAGAAAGAAGAGPPGGLGGIPPEGLISGAVPVWIVGSNIPLAMAEVKGRVEAARAEKPKVDNFEQYIKYLESLSSRLTGGVNELKGGTFGDIFRASGISAGGEYGEKYETEAQRRVDQVKKIQRTMAGGEEITPLLRTSAALGTGLHEKIEEFIKEQTKGTAEFERFVEYYDENAKVIIGHIDALMFKPGTKTPERLIDIKTVSKSLVNQIKKLAGEGEEVDFETIKNKVADNVRHKLEDAVSQVNFYIKALSEHTEFQQMGLKPEDIIGEIRLYDRMEDDPKKFVTVKTKFDPERFNKDIEAIIFARETMEEAYASTGTYEQFLQNAIKRQRGEIEKLSEGELKELITGGRQAFRTAVRAQFGPASRGGTKYKPAEEIRRYIDEKEKRAGAGPTIGKEEADPVIGRTLEDTLQSLKQLHSQAIAFHEIKGMGFGDVMRTLAEPLQEAIKDVEEAGPDYQSFIDLTNELRELDPEKYGGQIFKAWRLYRMAIGDFFLKQAETAKQQFDEAEKAADYPAAGRHYGELQRGVERMQTSITRQLGKPTDIYTFGKMWPDAELARSAGVFRSQAEIAQQAAGPIGEDPKLRGIFDKIIGDLTPEKAGDMAAPIEKVREAFEGLAGTNKSMAKLLEQTEMFRFLGDDVREAWNFKGVVDQITKLRVALQSFQKFNITEDYAVNQRRNLEDVIKILKKVENAYSSINVQAKQMKRAPIWGEIGTLPVPRAVSPVEQLGMHRRNLQRVREYFAAPREKGGPEIGERITYPLKVVSESGQIIKNIAVDFKKFGESVDGAGKKIGLFNEKQRDLIAVTQGATRGFKGAIERAVRWGFASSVVYGGFAKLKSAVGTLAEIETGMAQLRMVMSHVGTDFDMMSQAAVDFAKMYGVPITDVLRGMKIFAQQGLVQEEVIDRTKTATLAANVTTLTAKDATEALTAAMKVFRGEVGTSMRALDAWSEVEAKHAITAGDMADAIKKSAAAGRNAGFTFDELNGVIAAIGSVTRQTGKEVGTSMRFIFRRLTSEKAPKELAKIGIPVMTETGELRKGFEILDELSIKWAELGSAQKMTLAQAIGGTRQYNQLLVLMDNWDEALRALRDSTNSKGSAERRNVEIMKTYQKQLEQMRAAAVELQMAFGKIAFPFFKTAIKGAKTLFETLSSIPPIVKTLGVVGLLFVTFLTKGASIVQAISGLFSKSKSEFMDLADSMKKEWRLSNFEIFGRGATPAAALLKTVGQKKVKIGTQFEVDEKGVAKAVNVFDETIPVGKSLKDFHTGFGKLVFMIATAGRAYNEFVGDVIKGGGTITQKAGSALEWFGEQLSWVAGGIGAYKVGRAGIAKATAGGAKAGAAFGPFGGMGAFGARAAGRVGVGVGAKVGTGALKSALGPISIGISEIIGLASWFTGRKFAKATQFKKFEELKGRVKDLGLGEEDVKKVLKEKGIKGLAGKAGPLGLLSAEIAGSTANIMGEIISGVGNKVGEAGKAMAEDWTKANTGLVKSMAPLAITIAVLVPTLKAIGSYYSKITKNAQDYERAVYETQRANKLELDNIRTLAGEYDKLERKITKARMAADPDVKRRQQESETYVAPLTILSEVQGEAITLANSLAVANNELVAGYDKLGNAVLRTTVNVKDYVTELEKTKVKGAARKDIEVINKYITDLTQIEGPEKWKYELKRFLKEVPLVGDLLAKPIKVSPAKALAEASKSMNRVLLERAKQPLVTAFSPDIGELQKRLGAARKGFMNTYGDFKRVLAGIDTSKLAPKEIAELFTSPELKKGFELLVEIEPRFKLVKAREFKEFERIDGILRRISKSTAITAGDVIGAEILKRTRPILANLLDVNKILTTAKLETAGLKAREGAEAFSGDIVTFFDEVVKRYNIAGQQAVVKLKDTDEWVIEYFNTRTLQLEERPFTGDLQALVESIFPVTQVTDELRERLENLDQFVAGAAAGIRGMSPKDVKRDFSLGERFFGDIATSTLVQTGKGYNPLTARFGESPFQKTWQKDFNEYFAKPMKEYNLELSKLEKLRLGGLEGSAGLAKDLSDSLTELQTVLKNNQIVIQFRSAFADLTKSISESNRILKENIALEKTRSEAMRRASGYMKGIPEDVENLDVGQQIFEELTPRQRLLRRRPELIETSQRLVGLRTERQTRLEQAQSADRTRIAVQEISETAKGFGAQLAPEQLKDFVESVAKARDPASIELIKSTGKTAINTAATVDRLDSMLSMMGDQEAVQKEVTKAVRGGGRFTGTTPKFGFEIVDAMERIARLRERFTEKGVGEGMAATNNELDRLTGQLIKTVGLEKSMSLVSRNLTVFGKEFTKEEFLQRAIGLTGLPLEEFMRQVGERVPEIPAFTARPAGGGPGTFLGKPAFEQIKNIKKLRELQEDDGKRSKISSKSLIGIASGLTIFLQSEKGQNVKVVKNLEAQYRVTTEQLKVAKKEGTPTEKLEEDLSATSAALKKAKDDLDFKRTVQTMSALTAATGTFATQMGFSESDIKKLGGAALATYAGMKVVSSLMGKELGPAAKNFGAKIKEVTGKTVLKGKPLEDMGRKLYTEYKDAAKGFMEEYKSTVAGTGVTTEKIREAIKVSGAGMVELQAQYLRDDTEKRIKINRGLQLALTALTIALTNYANELKAEKGRAAELAGRGEAQGVALTRGITRDPRALKAAEDIIRERIKEKEETAKAAKTETVERSKVLDVEKELQETLKDTSKIRKNALDSIIPIAEEIEKAENLIARGEAEEKILKRVEDLKNASKELEIAAKSQMEVERMFAGARGTEGLLAGRYRPQPVDFGIRSLTEATPEEYLVATGAKIGKKSAESILRGLETTLQQKDLLAGTLEEFTAEREKLKGVEDRTPADEQRLESLNKAIDETSSSLSKMTETVVKAKDALREAIIRIETRQLGMRFVREERGISDERRLMARYGGPLTSNKQLRGFPGEVELPMLANQMSDQQQVFTELGDAARENIIKYAEQLDRVPRIIGYINNTYQQRIRSLQDEIYDLQQAGDVSEKEEIRIKDLKGSIEELVTARDKELSKLDESKTKLTEFGNVYKIVLNLSSSLKTLRDSLRDISIQETVEGLAGMKRYQEGLSNLFGGGGVGAPVAVMPEEERMAARVGVDLRHMQATRFQVEEARIRNQLTFQATSPEQRQQLRQRLVDLPEIERREREMEEQRRQVTMITRQVRPFEAQVSALEEIRRRPELTEEQRGKVYGIMQRIAESMNKALDRMSREDLLKELESHKGILSDQEYQMTKQNVMLTKGEMQYRGVPIWERKQQEEQIKGISSEIGKVLGGMDFKEFASTFADPQVAELAKHTTLLTAIEKNTQQLGSPGFGGSGGKSQFDSENLFEWIGRKFSASKAKQSPVDFAPENLFRWIERKLLPGKAVGGLTSGTGGPTGDKIPALLSDKEYVVKASSVKSLGVPALDHMNKTGRLPIFAEGGLADKLKMIGYAGGGLSAGQKWNVNLDELMDKFDKAIGPFFKRIWEGPPKTGDSTKPPKSTPIRKVKQSFLERIWYGPEGRAGYLKRKRRGYAEGGFITEEDLKKMGITEDPRYKDEHAYTNRPITEAQSKALTTSEEKGYYTDEAGKVILWAPEVIKKAAHDIREEQPRFKYTKDECMYGLAPFADTPNLARAGLELTRRPLEHKAGKEYFKRPTDEERARRFEITEQELDAYRKDPASFDKRRGLVKTERGVALQIGSSYREIAGKMVRELADKPEEVNLLEQILTGKKISLPAKGEAPFSGKAGIEESPLFTGRLKDKYIEKFVAETPAGIEVAKGKHRIKDLPGYKEREKERKKAEELRNQKITTSSDIPGLLYDNAAFLKKSDSYRTTITTNIIDSLKKQGIDPYGKGGKPKDLFDMNAYSFEFMTRYNKHQIGINKQLDRTKKLNDYIRTGGDQTSRVFQDMLKQAKRENEFYGGDLKRARLFEDAAKAGFSSIEESRLAYLKDPRAYVKLKELQALKRERTEELIKKHGKKGSFWHRFVYGTKGKKIGDPDYDPLMEHGDEVYNTLTRQVEELKAYFKTTSVADLEKQLGVAKKDKDEDKINKIKDELRRTKELLAFDEKLVITGKSATSKKELLRQFSEAMKRGDTNEMDLLRKALAEKEETSELFGLLRGRLEPKEKRGVRSVFATPISGRTASEIEEMLEEERGLFGRVSEWVKSFFSGSDFGKIEKMHTGGAVKQTGLKYLEKGEVVFPKKFQEGGLHKTEGVSGFWLGGGEGKLLGIDASSFANAIDDFENAVNRLEIIIKNNRILVDLTTPVPIDTGTPVPIDLTIPVPVDTTVLLSVDTTTPIPIDVTTPVPVDITTPISVDLTTPVPVDISVPLPVDLTVPISVDTTVPVPVDLTTPVPVDTSVLLSVDTTTLVPVDTTIPVPVDLTTPLSVDLTTPISVDMTTPIPVDITIPVPVDVSIPVPVDLTRPVPIDTTVPVPVDVTIPVPVDTTTPVPIDTTTPVNVNVIVDVNATEAAMAISSAIRSALTGLGGGTVGAEELNALSEAIDRMDSRVLQVSTETITMIARAENQLQATTASVEGKISRLAFDTEREISNMRNKAEDLRGSIADNAHIQGSQMAELDNRVNKVTALTMSNIGNTGQA